MAHQVSPLAPAAFPELPAIGGVKLAAAETGIRYKNRPDVLLAVMDPGTTVAGCFTRSKSRSAPVDWCAESLEGGSARAVVINAGNANAFTGKNGVSSTKLTAQIAAKATGAPAGEIFLASTGVIGEPLDATKFEGVLDTLVETVSPAGLLDAARAIMTTDTFPKIATAVCEIGGVEVRINGMAKGAGMIAPDMATMLGYIFTDAAVEPAFLQELLSAANQRTFSCITVDSDTSTSDTVMAFATGAAGNAPLASFASPGADAFAAALEDVCRQMAHLVVRDGEGAQKFITVTVSGAVSDGSARKVGLAIANSPLVKTAIAGEDANWGRVVMAVGKAGEPADRDRLSIGFGGTWAAREGQPLADYDEAPVAAHLKGQDISIEVDLGMGEGRATVWTCDLTHGYISINADYRS